MLIQCLWRCYAADKSFHSDATWQIYLKQEDEKANNNTSSILLPAQLGKVSWFTHNCNTVAIFCFFFSFHVVFNAFSMNKTKKRGDKNTAPQLGSICQTHWIDIAVLYFYGCCVVLWSFLYHFKFGFSKFLFLVWVSVCCLINQVLLFSVLVCTVPFSSVLCMKHYSVFR